MAARMSVEERRTRLVEAAITVMAREGVPHTTTRGIVAEAGMPIGSFHYCFRSKDELVLEVMRRLSERSLEAAASALESDASPDRLVRRGLDAYWELVSADPLRHLLSFELTEWALRRPDGGSAARDQYAATIAGLERLLVAVAAAGGFAWRSPVDELARLVVAVVDGVAFQWLATRDVEQVRLLLGRLEALLSAEAGTAG